MLNHNSLESALGFILANKLSDDVMPAISVGELFEFAFVTSPELVHDAASDILAVHERDAATRSYLQAILFLKGFQAIQVHRLAHCLWQNDRKEPRTVYTEPQFSGFRRDIHPACRMGHGIMLDHATGIVIGETTVIDDNVSILQQVTLGGTGNEQGDRHPKIKSGVLIAAGAHRARQHHSRRRRKIGAGSVVLADVASTRLWSEYPPRNQASRILRHRPKPCSKTFWQIPTRVDRLTGQNGQQTRACSIHVHELIESR